MNSDVKLTSSGVETLTKIPNHLHQGLKDSWPRFLRDAIEKIRERSFIFCKLVGVSAALILLKWLYWCLKVNNRVVFTLSHVQSERGFSINKHTLADNFKDANLTPLC